MYTVNFDFDLQNIFPWKKSRDPFLLAKSDKKDY